MELTSQHLVVVALWIIWCFVHSLMIAPVVTNRLKDKFGDHFRFYRLFFNTVALATFCPLALYSLKLKGEPVFVWDGGLVVVQYGLLSLSVLRFLPEPGITVSYPFLALFRSVRENPVALFQHTLLSRPPASLESSVTRGMRADCCLFGYATWD